MRNVWQSVEIAMYSWSYSWYQVEARLSNRIRGKVSGRLRDSMGNWIGATVCSWDRIRVRTLVQELGL